MTGWNFFCPYPHVTGPCKLMVKQSKRKIYFLSTCPLDKHYINPLSPNIHIQILQTDLHTSTLRISWENLIKYHGIFSMVIILLILITLSLDSVWILLGENWCWTLLGLKGLNLVVWNLRVPVQKLLLETWNSKTIGHLMFLMTLLVSLINCFWLPPEMELVKKQNEMAVEWRSLKEDYHTLSSMRFVFITIR